MSSCFRRIEIEVLRVGVVLGAGRVVLKVE